MSKKEKLIARLNSKPKDFTYQEAKKLLELLGFYEFNKGKTSGSRVVFIHKQEDKLKIKLHRPHPNNILKTYQLENILEGIKRLEELK